MMDNISWKEFYESHYEFVEPLGCIASRNDFVYGNLIDFVDRHVGKESTVLDLGCGKGAVSIHVASRGSSVQGIDISEKAVEAARKDAERFGLTNVHFSAGDIAKVDLKESYDVIICFDVIEHIQEDELMFKKINRLLRTGGKLLLRVPSESAPMHRLRIFLRGYDGFDRFVGHLRRYSKTSITSLLDKSGFRMLEMEDVEGVLRNFLFTTRLGFRPKRILCKASCGALFSRLDDLTRAILGGSGFNIASSKIGQPRGNGSEERK